jgi:hypothetical protein
LDRGAAIETADKIATGHNADDVAETVLLNILRGDVPRFVGAVKAVIWATLSNSIIQGFEAAELHVAHSGRSKDLVWLVVGINY